MILPLLLATLTPWLQAQSAWPTLRQELEKRLAAVLPIDDLDRQITSYAVLDTPSWFAIAYYWYHPNDLLPEELRVRTYDRQRKRWRSAVFKEHFGSVLHVRRHHGLFYITGHDTPSAAPTFVLSNELRLIRRIDGWPVLLLPDGRVVFQNSMVHFAPTHPESLSLYDPRNNRVRRLYPAREDVKSGLTRTERSIVSVTREPDGGIAIDVIEETVTITPDNSTRSEGPGRRFVVRCNVTGARPRCFER